METASAEDDVMLSAAPLVRANAVTLITLLKVAPDLIHNAEPNPELVMFMTVFVEVVPVWFIKNCVPLK